MVGTCLAAAITNIQPESESNIVDNAVEEVDSKLASDLETAETAYNSQTVEEVDGKTAPDLETAESALGVVVINKGYGGYRGGGYRGGGYRSGCGCGYGGSSRYHSHYRYYGKKK